MQWLHSEGLRRTEAPHIRQVSQKIYLRYASF